MSVKKRIFVLIPVYIAVLSILLLIGIGTNRGVKAFNETKENTNRKAVIIDAGHGDPDGGATSYSGKLESEINLEIALRLNDLMHFLGIKTVMTRSTCESVYTQGNTIGAKKISDLKYRVNLVNSVEDGILVSIHQNYFQEGKYSGAQVFYNNLPRSKKIATMLQDAFVSTLNPGSKRRPKRGEGIYLLDNVKSASVLIECGFLSNPEEDILLQDKTYQLKICSIIATCLSSCINAAN